MSSGCAEGQAVLRGCDGAVDLILRDIQTAQELLRISRQYSGMSHIVAVLGELADSGRVDTVDYLELKGAMIDLSSTLEAPPYSEIST